MNRVRALSPHIGARAELDGRPVMVWRARVEGGAIRPGRGATARAAGAWSYDAVPARAAGEPRPGGRPTRSSSASSRTTRTPTAPSPPRPAGSTRATGRSPSRSRTGRCSASATLDHAIEALGRRPVRKLDPPVRAALRLGAYQLALPRRRPGARGRERVGRARARGAARAGGAVHERGHAAARPTGSATLLDALPEGPLKHSYPDWIYETWRRDWGEDEALALMRAQNEPPETVVRLVRGEIDGEPTDVPGAYRVDRVDERGARARGGSGRRAAARSSPGSPSAPARASAMLDLCAAPGRQGDDARAARSSPSSCTRAAPASWRRTSAGSARRTSASSTPTALALPAELDGFDRALVDAPCSGLGVLAARPDLRWRAQPLPELQLALLRAAAERVKPGGTVVYSVCTLNADENEAVVDASGLAVEDLGAEWPAFRHPKRPEFLLTHAAPPRHSGFFDRTLARPLRGAAAVRSRSDLGSTGSARSRSSRRSMRRTSRGSASRSRCCSGPARASSTSTSATGTSSSRSRSARSCSSRSRR